MQQYKYYPYRLLQKLKLLGLFNVTVTSVYADKKFRIPILNNIGLLNLITTEKWMKGLIKTLLTLKEGIFIDVGANIGQTLMKLRSFSPVRYIGIEPNPECVVYLEKLIYINKIKGCTICTVDLSVNNTLLTLYGDSPAASGASMIKDFREANLKKPLSHTHIISVMTGDELINSLDAKEQIAIIKIDVEGAELEVLEGMKQTLSLHRPFIICEILPVYSLDKTNGVFRKERQDRVLSLLKAHNYSIFQIKNGNEFKFLAEIGVHGNRELSDYIFVPTEMKESFVAVT